MRVLWNGKKALWGTALLIAGPGVLFSRSRISFSFGTTDIQLEGGVWRVGEEVGWEWPVDYPREGIDFDAVANSCVKKHIKRLTLRPLCVHLCAAAAGRASKHNGASEDLWMSSLESEFLPSQDYFTDLTARWLVPTVVLFACVAGGSGERRLVERIAITPLGRQSRAERASQGARLKILH